MGRPNSTNCSASMNDTDINKLSLQPNKGTQGTPTLGRRCDALISAFRKKTASKKGGPAFKASKTQENGKPTQDIETLSYTILPTDRTATVPAAPLSTFSSKSFLKTQGTLRATSLETDKGSSAPHFMTPNNNRRSPPATLPVVKKSTADDFLRGSSKFSNELRLIQVDRPPPLGGINTLKQNAERNHKVRSSRLFNRSYELPSRLSDTSTQTEPDTILPSAAGYSVPVPVLPGSLPHSGLPNGGLEFFELQSEYAHRSDDDAPKFIGSPEAPVDLNQLMHDYDGFQLGRSDGSADEGDSCVAMAQTKNSSFTLRNRICTAYKIFLPFTHSPNSACQLPNDLYAICDHNSGWFIVNDTGDAVVQKLTGHDKFCCGVAATGNCIFLLTHSDSVWIINMYEKFEYKSTIKCPSELQGDWKLRKLGAISHNILYLMAAADTNVIIWILHLDQGRWQVLATEQSRRGGYDDVCVHLSASENTLKVLLCDARKSQLCTVQFSTDTFDLISQRSIRVRRQKGQEWIVQGPALAAMDDDEDILVYDASGKLFLFEGSTYRCQKIVADLQRNEVTALMCKNGWVYVLCKQEPSLEVFLYKPDKAMNST